MAGGSIGLYKISLFHVSCVLYTVFYILRIMVIMRNPPRFEWETSCPSKAKAGILGAADAGVDAAAEATKWC